MEEDLICLDSERVILNQIINSSDTFYNKEREIPEKLFYLDIHKKILKAIRFLYKNNNKIDYLMIDSIVCNEADYIRVGKKNGLKKLVNLEPKNLENAIERLKNLSIKRKLHSLGKELLLISTKNTFEDVYNVEKEIAVLNDFTLKNETKTETLEEVAEKTFLSINKKAEDFRNGIIPDTGVKTGIKALDDVIIGMKPRQLITLGARPSTGKTAFLGQLLINIGIKQQNEVLFFNFEMANTEISERFFTNLSSCNYSEIQRGNFYKNYDNSISEAFTKQSSSKIFLNDKPMTPDQMRIEIKKLKSTKAKNLKGIFIDYLEKIKVPKSMESKGLYEKVSYLSNEMKSIAEEFDIFVFCLAQLNRKVDERRNKRPILSDFNNSGVIEADSHCSFMLSSMFKYYPKVKELENIILLDVVKNRSGELANILLHFDGSSMKIREATKTEIKIYADGLLKIK